jgi:hypothetical protein
MGRKVWVFFFHSCDCEECHLLRDLALCRSCVNRRSSKTSIHTGSIHSAISQKMAFFREMGDGVQKAWMWGWNKLRWPAIITGYAQLNINVINLIVFISGPSHLSYLGLKSRSIKCDKYVALFTLTCFDQAWSCSEGVLFYQYKSETIVCTLILFMLFT